MKYQILLLPALIVFFISCSKDKNQIILENDIDGQVLFEEIYFGNNPNTKLSQLQDFIRLKSGLGQEELAEVKEMEQIILANMQILDERFFDDFNTNIRSGNHFQVQKALDYGGILLEKAMLSSPEIAGKVVLGKELASKIDIETFTRDDGTLDSEALNDFVRENHEEYAACGPTFCVAAVYLAIAISVAVFINYAGAINVYLEAFVFGPEHIAILPNSQSQLQRELMIDDIVNLL